MAEKKNLRLNQDYDTSQIETHDIAQAIDSNKLVALNHRKIHERRWYDNNFFDDGYHFRYLSRTTNKIVDLSERATVYTPQRAIPKASRQIRGVANLLLANDPTPTVYPENYPTSGNPQQDEIARKQAGDIARKKGWWLQEEWQEPDQSGESILEKIALLPILTAKHSVSYFKIWPDPHYEKIRTATKDAFDMYLLGSYNYLEDLPFMIEATPLILSQVMSNPNFDKKQLLKVLPDNKQADSMIKQAYLHARYGRDNSSDQAATVIVNEAYMKEYINETNIKQIKKQRDGKEILANRGIGDCIIRQVFSAGGVWLLDSYLDMDTYPYIDFRMEPGPLYSVPLIERFIPANKSLDSAVSRMERYFHTMVTGMWLKHRGEQFKINNIAGGQVLEYDAVPPTQANLASPGAWTFSFMNLLTNFIEEQGVSTTTLGKLPAGVKGYQAIESMKETEYANLVIATRRLNETVKNIARRMFVIADKHYLHPKSVSRMEKGKATYFQVIGKSALDKRKAQNIETPNDLITLSASERVDIEITHGMGFTKEGQKQNMDNLIKNTLMPLAEMQLVPMDAVKVAVEKYLEIYSFGSTAEFMEAFEQGIQQAPMDNKQMQQMQLAVLQALKDAGEVGQEASAKRIDENKVGVLEALKESGALAQLGSDPKVQAEVAKIQQDMQIAKEEHDAKMAQIELDMKIKSAQAGVDLSIKSQESDQNIRIKQAQTAHGMSLKEKMAKHEMKNPQVIQKGGVKK